MQVENTNNLPYIINYVNYKSENMSDRLNNAVIFLFK